MSRPTRIEYEGAFHHIMNRGRNHENIFHGQRYYLEFLKCVKEASEQFEAVTHAYCLMTYHYHLLIETPQANLGRIMRHINGVYTQRYNCLNKSDGPVFRGRYKSVDDDIMRYNSDFNVLKVLGSAEFKEDAIETFEETELEQIRNALNNRPSTDEIIRMVYQYGKTGEESIRAKAKGRREVNPYRAFAMFACRHYGGASQKQLAVAFELQHPGSAAYSINKVKTEIIAGKWQMQVDWLENQFDIVKPT